MSSNAFRRSLSGFNRKDVVEYIAVLSKRLDSSASKYNELKKKYDELANKDIVDTDVLNAKISSLKSENDELRKALSELEEEASTLRFKVETARIKLAEAEKKLSK